MEVLSSLVGKKLTDVYIVGFMYLEEGPNEFIPDFRWIYFEFEETLVEFESFNQFSRLRMEKVPDVRYRFEDDEDMIKVKSSVKELVLISTMLADSTVRDIEIRDGTEEDCAAAKEQEAYWQYARS